MNEQAAIDRILETENLTDGLEDEDANWLLDWGVDQVPELIGGINDNEAAGTKVNELMAVMRRLNQITADRAVKPPQALGEDITALAQAYHQAFGSGGSADPKKVKKLARSVAQKSPKKTMETLISWLKGA